MPAHGPRRPDPVVSRSLPGRPVVSRREVLVGGGAAAGAAALAASFGRAPRVAAQATPATPTRNIAGTRLRILQWQHFVPRYDTWFDPFAKAWGDANGVEVTVDHVNTADIPAAVGAEISAGEGHDLVEHIAPLPQLEESLLDLTDVVTEANNRHGAQTEVCRRTTFNPTTNRYFGFCHGWAPDPGNFRRTLWEPIGKPNGPATWQELLEGGQQIYEEQGIQMGIGMSNEIDSNMASLSMVWSFGGSVQDENENVVLNSPETVAAVEYMTQLYQSAMTPEVFGWQAASNNQLLIAGQASYILNSISAYRTAQQQSPDVANDVFFTPALTGPNGAGLVNGHALMNYMIPAHAEFSDTAREFLLYLVGNYAQAVNESELYHFPAWASTTPDLLAEGGPLDNDPFGSQPANKLNVLKGAESWTTNNGHPGPTNAVLGDVFAQFVLPTMMAKAARGDASPADAVAEADAQVRQIFETWAARGLVGGGRA